MSPRWLSKNKAAQILTWLLLSAGFALAHLWQGVLLLSLLIGLLWIFEKHGWNWIHHTVFGIEMSFAVGGVILGAPSYLMIAGAVASLAAWDLSDFNSSHSQSELHPLMTRFQQKRGKLLGLSLASGLLIAEIGLFIKIKLPFVVVLFIGSLVLFCLYKIIRFVKP